MSDRIVAELAGLAEGERAFEEILGALRDVLADLDRGLSAGLVQWDGAAKDAYRHAHEQWQAAADDMAGRLDRLRKVLGVSHRNYGRSLAANVRMWQG